MAEEQQNDSQLQDILAGSCSTPLVLQPLPMGQTPVTLHCDVSTDRIRPFVPEFFRREIFNNLHALSYPEIRASLKLVAERYVWQSMRHDVTLWALTCLQYQRAKVSRHSRNEIGRFEYLHLWDPFLLQSFRYCLICVDRFSKWPEAFPLAEISADRGQSLLH
ncbi:transposon Ty3-I Gag-Pol polyprotein [Nephila pilipes]|uniref:Transposon Ty3-I Gag-Pol polyprotein n=1 Tax=Nephila pilipes TaxID=299642 RepID=A0A8X6NK42_NEPPI|nr:transposon Ty3-I Gag-Pol polyprotein [Nephila pilipes]